MAIEAIALQPSLTDRIWNRVERVTPVPPQVVRATRIGLPRLAETFTHPSRTRTLFQAGRDLVREARRKDPSSITERFLVNEQSAAHVLALLSAVKLSAHDLVKIFAPDHAGFISKRVVNWREEGARIFQRRQPELPPEVPEVLAGQISPEFYARLERILSRKRVNLAVAVLGILDEEPLARAREGLTKLEDDIDSTSMSEEAKDRWVEYHTRAHLKRYGLGD